MPKEEIKDPLESETVKPGRSRKKGKKNKPTFEEKVYRSASYRKQVQDWRNELANELVTIGKRQNVTPMQHVAQSFYDHPEDMRAILKHMLPQLKAVEARIDSESPFRLIIDMSPEGNKVKDTKDQ